MIGKQAPSRGLFSSVFIYEMDGIKKYVATYNIIPKTLNIIRRIMLAKWNIRTLKISFYFYVWQ